MTTAGKDLGIYLGLDGARRVQTAATLETMRLFQLLIPARGLLCVYGQTGVGKTLSVDTNLQVLEDETKQFTTLRLDLPYSPKTGNVRHALAGVLGLSEDLYQGGDTTYLDAPIKQALADKPYVLFCDEVQNLSNVVLDYLRYLWDDKNTQLTLVLAGGERCFYRIRKSTPLGYRATGWQSFSPLTPGEVEAVIPHFHPLWQEVTPQDLLWTDDAACHGNFRSWTQLTFLLQEELDGTRFSRDAVRRVLAAYDGHTR